MQQQQEERMSKIRRTKNCSKAKVKNEFETVEKIDSVPQGGPSQAHGATIEM